MTDTRTEFDAKAAESGARATEKFLHKSHTVQASPERVSLLASEALPRCTR